MREGERNQSTVAPGDNSASNTDSTGQQQQQQPTGAQQAAQFSLSRLSRSSLSPSPFAQFHTWFRSPQLTHAVPETVTLSTASLPSGRVSSRIVYLKELDTRGFVIYSNFGTSRKAADIASNPFVSLCFWWKPCERQVRVEGRVERLTAEESQVYFDTRARGSREGAWASQQTTVLLPQPGKGGEGEGGEDGGHVTDEHVDDGRADLESRVADVRARFAGQDRIPVPPFWGGLRIIPETMEFWQGRESRLHDRFLYTRITTEGDDGDDGDGVWKIERLSP